MKLRWRLVLALIVASILPLFPLMISVRSVVDLGVNTLAPDEFGKGLKEAIHLARIYLSEQQENQENKLALIKKIDFGSISSIYPNLDSLETLYVKDKGDWYYLSADGMKPGTPNYFQQDVSFEKIPEFIACEAKKGLRTYRLEKKISPEVLEIANVVRAASAGWTIRSGERKRVINSLLGTYLVIYFVSILIAIVAGLVVIIPATRRIDNLIGIAEAVRSGDENARSLDKKGGEIGQLATTFNLMVDRLARSRRKAAEMEKMAAWRETARVLAHEIKNPLTPIQLSVQQISDSYTGDDELFARNLATTREIVDEEIESLRKLVREFSEFARAPKLELEEIRPIVVINDIISLYGDRLTSKINDSGNSFYLDREKLKRALINLLDNALAATGEESNIQLLFTEKEHLIEIVIEDNGTGVPDDEKETVFEPYYTTKSTGVGLGLPIVKTTIDQHGGEILLDDSESLGGARFTIKIPYSYPSEDVD